MMKSRVRRSTCAAAIALTVAIASAGTASATVAYYHQNTIGPHSYVYTAQVTAIYSNYIGDAGMPGQYPRVSVFYIRSNGSRANEVYGYGSAGYYGTGPSPARAACSNEESQTITAKCEWNYSP